MDLLPSDQFISKGKQFVNLFFMGLWILMKCVASMSFAFRAWFDLLLFL